MTEVAGRRGGRGRRPARQQHGEAADAEPQDPVARARAICLRLLTSRARTRQELATALGRRGVDEDVVAAVLDRFAEVGLIDDAAFAESYVHSGHTYRGLGRRALAADLRRKGVDAETAGEAVAAIEPDAEEEMARTLVRRRLAGSAGVARPGDGPAEQAGRIRKLVGMLARRGYSEGLAYRVVRDELRAAGHDTAVLDDA
ncbi:MAG TPA: regulatory protein RecX [Pseudonocardiaceae bacterium]